MLADERQSRIIELLREEGTVYTSDLVNRFQTSRETIRRDLSELEQKGALKKVYGGATGTEASSGGRPSVLAPYEKRIRENLSGVITDGRALAICGFITCTHCIMLCGRFFSPADAALFALLCRLVIVSFADVILCLL